MGSKFKKARSQNHLVQVELGVLNRTYSSLESVYMYMHICGHIH